MKHETEIKPSVAVDAPMPHKMTFEFIPPRESGKVFCIVSWEDGGKLIVPNCEFLVINGGNNEKFFLLLT
jgi:hypothetical protein